MNYKFWWRAETLRPILRCAEHDKTWRLSINTSRCIFLLAWLIMLIMSRYEEVRRSSAHTHTHTLDGGRVCVNVPLLLCLRSLWRSSNLQLSGTHSPSPRSQIISRLWRRDSWCQAQRFIITSLGFHSRRNQIDLDSNKPTHIYPQDNRNRHSL